MEFRLLGPLEATRAGRRVELGGGKQRAVLAHLLVRANHVVSAERLIDDVWGDEPPDAARKSVQAYVSRLRRALGDGIRIEGRPPGYLLVVEPSRIDAVRFEGLFHDALRLRAGRPEAARDLLVEALSLWRGPALDDLGDEPSLQPEIARLEELRLSAVEERFEVELALGRASSAVPELEALTREHPLRERLWSLLMLALYRAGRQGDALGAFVRARTVLSEELGVEPSPELQRLQSRILAQDSSLSASLGSLRGYELRERIGSGRTGVLYRALQPNTDREVAIRVIDPQIASRPDFIRRFEGEAQVVARLEHPQIAPLYDYWRGPEGAFLVTPWLRGGNLREASERRTFDRTAVARIAEQIGSALIAAHQRGVAHGDVWAGNVLFDEAGDAYLSDFRIGVAPTAGPQAESDAFLDDQSQLAKMLSGLLAGHHRTGEPPEFEAIFDRATAAVPSARYVDVGAFIAAFIAALGRPTPAPPPTRATNPYKGLRAFQEADHQEFFGRRALVAELVDRLGASEDPHRFVAVVGASGSGKSSVVRAGLVPALRRGEVSGSDRWFIVEMFPGITPFHELDEALLRVAADGPSTFINVLSADERGLARAIEGALPPDGSELLLVVDQFEELFTLAEQPTRDRFIDAVVSAVHDPDSRLRVVVTLRGDFYDRPLAHRALGELLSENTVTVLPLTPDELAQAIIRPAERSGIAVDADLAATISADVVDQPGVLPLLQYSLTELFERQRDGRMTLGAYRSLGGIAGAVARRADELYAALDATGREAARQLFMRLVTLGEGSEDTRRRIPLSELTSIAVDQPALASVVEVYGRHRLLSFDRDPTTREPTVEVAHEALLDTWGRLRTWIDDARDDLRSHRHLALAARDWEESGRDRSDLWRGGRLDHAEAWSRTGAVALTDLERCFLAASIAARDAELAREEKRRRHELELERRSVRRLRALAVVLAAAVFGTAILTALVFAQSQEAARRARVATAGELAAQAMDQLEVDPDRAILLAIEAVEATRRADGTVMREAEEALHAAVLATRIVERQRPRLRDVIISTDWAYEAVVGPDGLTVVSTATGERVVTLPESACQRPACATGTVAVSPDRRHVAVGGPSWPRLWAVESLERLPGWPASGDGGARSASSSALAFSPDGRRLAAMLVGSEEGEVRVWDVPSAAEVFRLSTIGGSGGGHGLSWSPDGSRLAVATGADTEIFDVSNGFAQTMVLPGEGQLVRLVTYSPGGDRLLVTGLDFATLWDAATGDVVQDLPGHIGWVFAHAFSADGTLAATSAGDGIVRVWSVASGNQVLALPGVGRIVEVVRFSPDATRLYARGGPGTLVFDITPAAGHEVWSTVAAPGSAYDLRFSADGGLLASTTDDGRVITWDATTAEPVGQNADHERNVFDVDFSPDGQLMASAGHDGEVHLLRPDGELVRTVDGHTGPVWSVDFRPDGTQLVTASEDGTNRVWDVASGTELARFSRRRVAFWDAVWSPDGSLVATVGNDNRGWIWDPDTEKAIRSLRGHEANVVQAAFSPDGTRVATVGFDAAMVWEIASRERVFTLPYPGTALDVEILPDGSRWVVSGRDGTVRFFDAATGRETLAIKVGVDAGRIAISPDGRRLAVGTGAGPALIRLLALDVDELLQIARQRTTRPLTDAECRQYLDAGCPPETGAKD